MTKIVIIYIIYAVNMAFVLLFHLPTKITCCHRHTLAGHIIHSSKHDEVIFYSTLKVLRLILLVISCHRHNDQITTTTITTTNWKINEPTRGELERWLKVCLLHSYRHVFINLSAPINYKLPFTATSTVCSMLTMIIMIGVKENLFPLYASPKCNSKKKLSHLRLME